MHMNEIQYTHKPCKVVLILSIHENHICILENPKPVIPKSKLLNLCVCENLSITRLSYPYTRPKTKLN